MKYLIFLITLVVSYYFYTHDNANIETERVEQEVDKIIINIDDIENSQNVDEVVKNTESFNQNAFAEFQQIKVRAKSPASLQFVNLTEKQNQLANQGMILARQMQPLVNQMTSELVNNPEQLPTVLIPLCTHLREYIPVFSGIVDILSTKSKLIHEQPIVSTELMNGQHEQMKELMSHMLASQSRILEDEKKAYVNLRCDEYLAPSEQETAL